MARPLGPRVDALEDAVADLRTSQEKLRQDHDETREIVAALKQMVEGIPAKVKRALDSQTDDFRVIVAESETRNADRIIQVARQAPAWALVAVTLTGTLIVTVLANWILAAEHLPHIH